LVIWDTASGRPGSESVGVRVKLTLTPIDSDPNDAAGPAPCILGRRPRGISDIAGAQ